MTTTIGCNDAGAGPGVICWACKAQGDWRHGKPNPDGSGRWFLCDACFSRGTVANPHPAYYGGADNPYEAIKVIRAWGLNFALGNVLKYIRRCDEKGGLDDLRKARTYLDEEIAAREGAQ